MNTDRNIDISRVYAVRCPCCKLFMNVAGISLQNPKDHIMCKNCKCIAKAQTWIDNSSLT